MHKQNQNFQIYKTIILGNISQYKMKDIAKCYINLSSDITPSILQEVHVQTEIKMDPKKINLDLKSYNHQEFMNSNMSSSKRKEVENI